MLQSVLMKWILRMVKRRELNFQEREVRNVVDELGIEYEANRLFRPEGKFFFVDFYLPSLKLAIECTFCRAISSYLKGLLTQTTSLRK